MTVEEFKKDYPELSHLKGEELLDAMTMKMLRQQSGEEIIKNTYPFLKRYQLRWLFYRRPYNSPFIAEWQSDEVCKICGRGANTMMAFAGKMFCLGCHNELNKVPNKRFKYRAWVWWKQIDKKIELILDYLHILRKRNESRYGVFGDESHYCYQTFNRDFSNMKNVHKPRKWFEYIFIKK
jgi:hypothetical protein